MSRDALFQLGMGSVLLKTSQEEDTLRTLVSGLAGKPLRMLRRPMIAIFGGCGHMLSHVRRGGNSAQARTMPAAAAGIF